MVPPSLQQIFEKFKRDCTNNINVKIFSSKTNETKVT